ncbi:hypothetical protein ABUL17_07030 [Enterobacter hormaechei]|uniref:hypothetical protein n=1 Tax=Enterobacter TaxID=547 RepID=UPI002005C033|nr:hypothetical protein [Enterobacter hormaechei]MCK7147899.1 hypothetical protein [Enterobacter bugandensis]
MIAELSAAMAAIKETAGLAKVINDAKTDAEVKAATIELQNRLITLQAECFSLGDVIRQREEEAMLLKAKIAEYEDFNSQTEGYVFNQLDSGTFVYSKEQTVGDTKVTVHLCPQCFTKRVVSILQPTGEPYYNAHTKSYFHQSVCHNCNASFSMNNSKYQLDVSWLG